MNEHDPDSTHTTDRRKHRRQSLDGTVRVRFDVPSLEGPASNISKSGVLFFTDGELTVTLEIEQGGEVTQCIGHLVRCERIKGERRGWAVEFHHE